jgi:small basic protein
MALVALLFAVLGFVLVYFQNSFNIPIGDQQYLSLASLAGLDSLVGGIRAATEGMFQSNVFVSGFVVNTLLAVFLAYLGERLGQDLALAAVVLLGGRTFVNLSIIRRHWLEGRSSPHAGVGTLGTGQATASGPDLQG